MERSKHLSITDSDLPTLLLQFRVRVSNARVRVFNVRVQDKFIVYCHGPDGVRLQGIQRAVVR
jgi:hypothetical protein